MTWVGNECMVKRLVVRVDSVAENAAYALVVRDAEERRIMGVVVLVLHPLLQEGRRGLGYVKPG